MKKDIVIGHKNPDTDSVCSAIIYSWYLNKKNLNTKPFIAGNITKETKYVLSRFKFETPEIIKEIEADRNIHIVDTNNKDELISGIETADIESIVDHHLLYGALTSNKPIEITIKPYGCTATILLEKCTYDSIEVDKDIAGLMLSCILSDTLNLTSPTTTDEDKKAVEKLEKLTGISKDELANEMFAANGKRTYTYG